MRLAASASFRAAGAGGDVDPEDPACGAYSADLWRRGIDHNPCGEAAGHTTAHCFEAVERTSLSPSSGQAVRRWPLEGTLP